MDQKELEIARLNASLAVAKGELRLAAARPRAKGDSRVHLLAIIIGLGLGVGLGFGPGFSTAGAEQFLRQEFARLSSTALIVTP